MDGKSFNITEEKINNLKEVIPEAFNEGKIDWEKLKAALGEDVEFKNERYVLNWAGKSDAFKILQSSATATLVPCKDESVNFANTENFLYELLLKSGIPVTAKIEQKEGYFLVTNGEEVRPQEARPQIALILGKVDEKIIKTVISVKPQKVITLDRLFKKNDQLKTNTALQMKDAEIEFKVV